MTDFQTVLSRCQSCVAGLMAGALYCTHCGLALADPCTAATRRLSIDQARDLWGAGERSPHGPFEVKLAADERPVLWQSDGRSPILLTARGEHAFIYRLLFDQEAVRLEIVIADLNYENLRAVCVTPSGVFAVDGTGLTAARQDPSGGWMLSSSILPSNSHIVGLAADSRGRLHALVVIGDQLRLYGGRGMTRLGLAASGPSGDYGGWYDLSVAATGAVMFWGGGNIGRVELDRRRIIVEVDDRAPDQSLKLKDRGEHIALRGAALASPQGAVPAVAKTASGWGLLSAAQGRFFEAPPELARPMAVTGLAGDCAVLLGRAGPTLARMDGSGHLAAIPTGGWGRDVPTACALAAIDGDVLALINSGASADAYLLRADDARRSLALVGAAHFEMGRRAMAAPTPISSLPPLALAGGVAVGMMLDNLSVWLAPWAEAT